MSISRGVNIDIFEPAWYLRGMETLLIDFVLNPEIAQSCLDRMTDIKCKIAGKFASIGIIEEIIPDLTEVGVAILNPVQPECMNPKKIKQDYGDKLTFWGAIGTQTTRPFSTPIELKRTVEEIMLKIGYNSGLLIAPSHLLEPDFPWNNIIAFVEAVKGFHFI